MPLLAPIERRRRKADLVADDLLRRIVSGAIPVGSTLPRESELATEYGVNRSVVREAVKLLEVHRLVRPVRRRGTEVLDPAASLSPEVLHAMLVPEPGRVDLAVFRGFLEIRASLDVEMSAAATARRTAADLAAMEAILDEMAPLLGDADRYTERVGAFGVLVARAAHNPMYPMLVNWGERVASELGSVFRAVRPASEPHLQGLRLLVGLIRARDAEQTRRLVAAFHRWATPRLLAAAALANGEPLDAIASAALADRDPLAAIPGAILAGAASPKETP